ncbi:hypothetical protein SESBI_25378 [Sesbania bispinosa]|nr:hypothetical protein SESBI_25378 [Sesbania bispinosa]
MASAQPQKPSTAIEVCQPKTQHSSFGQKISEITSKAFKGHHARHGSSPNQLQCNSQTQVESHGQNGSKTESHYYGHQTQTQHDKKHGVSKTQITVTVVQAQITQTHENPSPYGTTTNCFGGGGHAHAKKNESSITIRRKGICSGGLRMACHAMAVMEAAAAVIAKVTMRSAQRHQRQRQVHLNAQEFSIIS